VLQCVAVCCSAFADKSTALSCVAVRCRMLQSVSVCCNVLQCGAVCLSWSACKPHGVPSFSRSGSLARSLLILSLSLSFSYSFTISDIECARQHTPTHMLLPSTFSTHFNFNTLQHTSTSTHFNTLQHIATHCNTLQHAATHCNTLGIFSTNTLVPCTSSLAHQSRG